MLGMVSQYNSRAIFIEPEYGWESYYKYIKPTGLTNHDFLIGWVGLTGSDGMITENVDKKLPRAIIFRDSFFSALEPFTSTLFSSAEYNWRWFNETEKDYILNNKPDIIIWEIVERGIGRLLDSPWD
jgi:hypothetical protein